MKATLLAISTLFVCSSTLAAEPWEICLDEGDFSFSADTSFLKNSKVVKSGCVFRFSEISAKGQKFEVNVCDPNTKIEQFPSIDATSGTKHIAGSAGCPAPLFGADIDTPSGASAEFPAAKAKVFEIFNSVKKAFGAKSADVDLAKATNIATAPSEVKIACAELLIGDYLNNCVAVSPKVKEITPAKADESKKPSAPLPPGIHPATIEKK